MQTITISVFLQDTMRQTLIRHLYSLDLWCLSVLKIFLLIKILENVFQVFLLHFIAHFSTFFCPAAVSFFCTLKTSVLTGSTEFVSLQQGHVSERYGGEALGPGGTLGQRGAFEGGCSSAVIFLPSEVEWKAVFHLTLYVSFLSHCFIWLYVEYASTFEHIKCTVGSRRAAWPRSAGALPAVAPVTPKNTYRDA